MCLCEPRVQEERSELEPGSESCQHVEEALAVGEAV